MSDLVEAPEAWATFSPSKRAILIALPVHRTLTATADAVGVERSTVWRWATDGSPTYDPEFSTALQQVKQQVADEVEAKLLQQAVSGGTAWDTTARIFYLKMARPEYRDNATLTLNSTITVNHTVSELTTDDQLAILQLMQRRLIASAEGEGEPEGDDPAQEGEWRPAD